MAKSSDKASTAPTSSGRSLRSSSTQQSDVSSGKRPLSPDQALQPPRKKGKHTARDPLQPNDASHSSTGAATQKAVSSKSSRSKPPKPVIVDSSSDDEDEAPQDVDDGNESTPESDDNDLMDLDGVALKKQILSERPTFKSSSKSKTAANLFEDDNDVEVVPSKRLQKRKASPSLPEPTTTLELESRNAAGVDGDDEVDDEAHQGDKDSGEANQASKKRIGRRGKAILAEVPQFQPTAPPVAQSATYNSGVLGIHTVDRSLKIYLMIRYSDIRRTTLQEAGSVGMGHWSAIERGDGGPQVVHN